MGAECVKHILKASDFDEVRVLDLFDRNLPQDDRINFIKGSVNDFELCLKSVEGVSAVLHIAAVVDLRYEILVAISYLFISQIQPRSVI